MLKGKRGTSEVLGALLVASIVIAMSVSWLTFEATRATRQTMSVVDLIRAAGRRQRQLLSLTYYHKQGNKLTLYIYNYGEETSNLKLIVIDQTIVLPDSMENMNTGESASLLPIPPKNLVRLEFEVDPSKSDFVVLLLTNEGGIFSWKLSTIS